MTLLRRPVVREISKRKSPISEDNDHGDELSEITDNSSLPLITRKTKPYHSRIAKSDKYNRSKCNPTPVTNGADDDLFEEINTGPDPFPFRPPRQDRINQLISFYQQYLETTYEKGRSFCLEDFILENGQTGIERELDESLKRSSDDREVSRQNYLLSYQRNDFVGELTKEAPKEILEKQKCHAHEIAEILKLPNLNRVDLNKLVDIDLVPRRIPIFQNRLNAIQAMNEKRLEKLKETYEVENKCSRISFAENENPMNSNTPATVLNRNVYDTPTEVKESKYQIEDHIVDGRYVADNNYEESEDEDQLDFNHEGALTRELPLPPITRRHTQAIPNLSRDCSEIPRTSRPSVQIIKKGRQSQQTKVVFDSGALSSETGRESVVRTAASPITAPTPSKPRRWRGSKSTNSNYPFSALELAVFDSLAESGGLTLSLRGWFLPTLPTLQPLNETLVYLNLAYNSIHSIPPFITTCGQLQVLKLRNNPLESIPDELINLSRLRILILSYCNIKVANTVIFKLPSLVFLDLSYNFLSDLPDEISQCTTLRYLNICGNELRGLPCSAINMSFQKIKIKNNYMGNAFWKDMQRYQPARLENLALGVLKTHLTDQMISNPLRKKITKAEYRCAICKDIKIGQVYPVLRPCSDIWDQPIIPFIFKCCSFQCLQSAKEVKSNTDF